MGDIIARGMAGKALRGVSPATIDSAGIVKPDGNSITIDADGTIHASGAGGSVADQINTAIEGLDANITSSAVEEGKGIQVQVAEADGKITNVNVTGNFDNKYDASGAAAAIKGELDAYKGTNDAAVAAAKKAGDDAQSDLNAYKGTVSTTYETKTDATAKLTEAKGYTDTEIGKVNTKIGTVAEGKTVVGLINEAKQAAIDEASYDDTQVKADIAANTSAIATLNGNASTTGSVAKAVADAVAGIVPGIPSDYIKTASVSGNILTLTKNDDTSITFTALSENEVNSLIDAKLEVVENGSY